MTESSENHFQTKACARERTSDRDREGEKNSANLSSCRAERQQRKNTRDELKFSRSSMQILYLFLAFTFVVYIYSYFLCIFLSIGCAQHLQLICMKSFATESTYVRMRSNGKNERISDQHLTLFRSELCAPLSLCAF